MNPSFRLTALSREPFAGLFQLNDNELAQHNAQRVIASEKPGYPCRVSLAEAEIGESLLLLQFAHHDVASPYAASGPVFVRENAATAQPAAGEIPEVVRSRLMSVRGYDAAGMMLHAEVIEGRDVEQAIARQFADAGVAYIHLHNAKRGCYSCRVDRV
jgi:hypothetical protein